MSRPSRWSVVRWIGLALALGVAGAVLLGKARERALAERLVRDANALAAAPRTRPLHVDRALPGTFGDSLASHLPPIERAWRGVHEDPDQDEAVRQVVGGTRTTAQLPPRLRDLLAALGPHLDGVLRATRAESAAVPFGEDAYSPISGATWIGIQGVASLAAVRVRQALARGQVGPALGECLDGLALARDASLSGGLVGNLVASALVVRLQLACDVALGALPAPERPAATARVRVIRDAWQPFDRVMAGEAVDMQLCLWGGRLSQEQRSRLADHPRRQADTHECAVPFRDRLLPGVAWARWRALHDRMGAAAAQPGAERDRVFEELATEVERGWFSSQLPRPRDYLRYGRILDAARLRLDLLVAASAARAYRSAHGAWPGDVKALRDEGLLDAAEAQRLQLLQLSDPCATEQVLEIRLPLAELGTAQLRLIADR